jgi:hypothetical protein
MTPKLPIQNLLPEPLKTAHTTILKHTDSMRGYGTKALECGGQMTNPLGHNDRQQQEARAATIARRSKAASQ